MFARALALELGALELGAVSMLKPHALGRGGARGGWGGWRCARAWSAMRGARATTVTMTAFPWTSRSRSMTTRMASGRTRGGTRVGAASDAASSVYDAPEIYDVAFGFRDFDKEIDFLETLVREYGALHGGGGLTSALELGAGPAWHSLACARRGIQAVALERNPAMRAYANDKKAAVEASGVKLNSMRVVDGDMRHIELPHMMAPEGGFDCVVMLLGTVEHLLTYDDAISCMTSVRKQLKPGGLFVVELEHPWDLFSGDLSEGVGDAWDRVDEERGVKVLVEWGRDGDEFDIETQVYERTVSFNLIELDGNENTKPKVLKTVEEVVPCKIYTAPEFKALARAASLAHVGTFGDMSTTMALDDEDAHNMVLVFRRDD